jgi:asparagine synthase (glutamine-hydrolysing)
MVDDVLTKIDRAAMSVSLEGREPLLDHRIIEYMARVPMKIKYKMHVGKYLSRTILYRHIPKTLVDKPKSGFTIPLNKWLQGDLNALAVECLSSSVLVEDDIFDAELLRSLTNDLVNKRVREPTFIWMIIVYVMWRKQWK